MKPDGDFGVLPFSLTCAFCALMGLGCLTCSAPRRIWITQHPVDVTAAAWHSWDLYDRVGTGAI
jgi:hypothetical protein